MNEQNPFYALGWESIEKYVFDNVLNIIYQVYSSQFLKILCYM